MLADRGYSTARGIGHVAAAGGQLIVRVNTGALLLRTLSGEPFDLLAAVAPLRRAGVAKSWSAQVVVDGDTAQPSRAIAGRVCALRKSAAAIKLAHRKVRKEATRKGKQAQPDTLRFAEYVIVFTTFPAATFSAAEILEWYRLRWQVELVFKRFKSLAQLGRGTRRAARRHASASAVCRIGQLIATVGLERVGARHVRHLTGPPWQMRFSGRDGIARARYVVAKDRRVVVVRAFVKKARRTPRREIEVALRRAGEVSK